MLHLKQHFSENKHTIDLKTSILTFLFLLFISTITIFAQNATIKGLVLDENNLPISNVNVTYGGENGAVTDLNGFYLLKIPELKYHLIKILQIFSEN